MRVALLNTFDKGGGAEEVARNLFLALPDHGLEAEFVVRLRRGKDERVTALQRVAPFDAPPPSLAKRVLDRMWRDGTGFFSRLTDPRSLLEGALGLEPMHFPKSHGFLNLLDQKPDLVHAHNLHGDYFDLRSLPELSHQVPVLITMHDQWLTTGHCASPVNCEKWKTGCGGCPDLTIYPPLKRDGTALNWRIKSSIYQQSKIYIAAPAQHLVDSLKQSMVWPAVQDVRVIPNGIDLSIFTETTTQKSSLRGQLGLPTEGPLLLTVANSIRTNKFKDYDTVKRAMAIIAEEFPDVKLVVVGSTVTKQPGEENIEFVPYTDDKLKLARYYQASDVFLHAAKKEAWGLTATEAMACGVPVVATAVEGLKEQVLGLKSEAGADGQYDEDKATGILVDRSSSVKMANAIRHLLSNEALTKRVGLNAARHAMNFSVSKQVDSYKLYYDYITRDHSNRIGKEGT